MAQTPKFTIDKFGGTKNENIKTFLTIYDNAAAILKWTEELKFQYLPMYLTGEAAEIYNYMKTKGTDTYAAMKLLLETKYKPDELTIRNTIKSKIYKEGEVITKYISEIQCLCLRWDPTMKEDKICRKIIKGLTPTLIDWLASLNNSTVNAL